MHSTTNKSRPRVVVYIVILSVCLSVACGGAVPGLRRGVDKRYAMMDLALSQIYDICDSNGDRMLAPPELLCVQQMGNSILGKRRK